MTEHATAPKRTTTRAKRPHLRAVPDLPKFTAANAKQHRRPAGEVMAAREAPPTTGAVIATDLGVCPHCERSDGVERYMLDEDTPTSARYCSHCETRWRGKREAKAAAA
jgi:hypothetical protein